MLVYVQWTLAAPQDWRPVEVTALRNRWRSLAKRPVPTGGETIDNTPGWIFALNCQGILMRGFDHYHVEPITDPSWGDGLRFTLWQDDVADIPAGERWATVWELFEPALDEKFPLDSGDPRHRAWMAANPRHWGYVDGSPVHMNTRQRRTVYQEQNAAPSFSDALPWDQFVPPTDHVAHGVWVSDELFAEHHAVAMPHSWREWVP